MHNFVLLLLLTTNLFTPSQQQKEIINFAFFYPFFSNEISQPGTYNVTDIIEYGIEQFNSLSMEYELKMQIFDSNCNARDGIRAYIEMLQLPEFFPFIIGELKCHLWLNLCRQVVCMRVGIKRLLYLCHMRHNFRITCRLICATYATIKLVPVPEANLSRL